MELKRIIEILEKHQEWRRDQNVPPKTEMQSPVEIGIAIDYALTELKKLRLGDEMNCLEFLYMIQKEWCVSEEQYKPFYNDVLTFARKYHKERKEYYG